MKIKIFTLLLMTTYTCAGCLFVVYAMFGLTDTAHAEESAVLKIITRIANNGSNEDIQPSDFTVYVESNSFDVPGSPAPGSEEGMIYSLPSGVYRISEDDPTPLGFNSITATGDCDPVSGEISLQPGDFKTCILTNSFEDNTETENQIQETLAEETGESPDTLSASCSASPQSSTIGVPVLFKVNTLGGTGNYQYYWTGSENLTGNTASINKSYVSFGSKQALVTVYSGSESFTAVCSVNIVPPVECVNCKGGSFDAPNVIVKKDTPAATLEEFRTATTVSHLAENSAGSFPQYVALSDMPSTGLVNNWKIILFTIMLFSISLPWALVVALGPKKIMRKIFTRSLAAPTEPYPIYSPISLNDNHPAQKVFYHRATVAMPIPPNTSLTDILEIEAYKRKSVISRLGLAIIADLGENNPAKSLALLGEIIRRCPNIYDREDGCFLLNKERVLFLLGFPGFNRRHSGEIINTQEFN